MILRLPLGSKFKEDSTKTTGNWTLLFSANVWRTNSIKASFAPTSLQSCKFMHNCLLAPDAPSGNRAEDMWSFQMLDTEAGRKAHPEGYSSSFGLSRFQESTAGSQRVPREAYSKCYCSSKVFQDCWDSEKDLLEVFSICCPASQVCSDCWDFERLEVEGLPTDSLPCWGSGGFPNCQNCVHRESSNYCWIGQGDVDVSIPSKLHAIMKSTCYPVGKDFEASQSHRKLRPICSTCSLAVWVLKYNTLGFYCGNRHHCQHLWKFRLEDTSSGCCWDQFHRVSVGPEKTPLQLPPGHCCSSQVSQDCWDFERLEVEGLPTDSMPCWGSRGFPNCQNCVHQESSNYCWIGQGDVDVSIPSKLQAKMKSTCCPAGKALQAWHHRIHKTTRSLCQHLWKLHLEDSSSGCCWDQLHKATGGPEKISFQPPPGHCCSSWVLSDY